MLYWSIFDPGIKMIVLRCPAFIPQRTVVRCPILCRPVLRWSILRRTVGRCPILRCPILRRSVLRRTPYTTSSYIYCVILYYDVL